jgi:lysophospholipase L1-like esterase
MMNTLRAPGLPFLLAILLAMLLATFAPAPGGAEDAPFPPAARRILFLGDSITYAGGYVEYLDAFVTTRFPDHEHEFINLGLPSEGVTGLSEPDHPFPRPNVHERLDRALRKIRPDLVVACYGMNDGIYYPFSEERFAEYRRGIERLVERVLEAPRESGGLGGDRSRFYLLTPPAFDPVPLGGRVLPAGAPKYSWMSPYAAYDEEVLHRYAAWLRTLRQRGIIVVDAHSAVHRHLAEVRKRDRTYSVAGDGVHPNPTGEWLIAASVLDRAAPGGADTAVADALLRRVERGAVRGVEREGLGVAFRWRTRLPMPYDPGWDPRLDAAERITERFNRHRLTVLGLPKGRYALFEGGTHVAEVTDSSLREGLELTRYPALSTNRRAAEVLKLIHERDRMLGRAWLTEVGHQRPDTPKGLPLEEALRRAAPLTARIRALVQPRELELHLRPVK